jgi:hypothetical protein
MGNEITRRHAAKLFAQTVAAAPLASSGIAQAGKAAQAGASSAEASGSPVYVVLWFDTEDYILPASDNAAKRIAEFLTGLGLRATFKIVGEKARVLEQRQRFDVIAALSRHEIGYHSNTHSQQPTPAVYESELDWRTGKDEFTRRERPGFDDLERIFGLPPSCYGQPGVSWAPQAYAALKEWGVRVYLDDGDQVQLDGKPFWYGGLLNIFHIDAGRTLGPNRDWSNLPEAKADFQKAYSALSSSPNGGTVSFMFHPTQLITDEFWDAANFADGANPPREAWKFPPEKSPADRERAFTFFESLIRYVHSFPRVRFVTASEAFVVYRDQARDRVFAPAELDEIAQQVSEKVSYQSHGQYALACSEVFFLLNRFAANFVLSGEGKPVRLTDTPFGPVSPAVTKHAALKEVAWAQFSRTVIDVDGFLERERSLPNVVWLGTVPVSPEVYLTGLAHVVRTIRAQGKPPASVPFSPAELAAVHFVSEDSAGIWKWPIFPPGFHSAHLMQLARLQAWTLKPAMLVAPEAKNAGE